MLTRNDIAKRYNVSERTIDRWIKMKGLPVMKSELNGRVYINEEDLEKWEKEKLIIHGRID